MARRTPPRRADRAKHRSKISRRAVMLGTAGVLIVGRGAVAATIAPAADSLRAKAEASGRVYGAAARQSDLVKDEAYRRVFAAECGLLVPENELKWKTLRPSSTRYDFAAADWLADFARQHQMKFKGHTLVWHDALPGWVAGALKRGNARGLLSDHIDTVCRRYAGVASSWDVVNEAIDTSSSGVDGLRASPWRSAIGPDYIELAFNLAHRADPGAMLVYNDYGLELDGPWDEARRQRVLRLLRELKQAGAPIHALGIQAHLEPHRAPFNADRFAAFLHEVAALDLKIVISELDVADRAFAGDESSRDQAVAALYGEFLGAALRSPAVNTVITWGLSDRYSWLNYTKQARRPDGRPNRGLPLSNALERKPAYAALAQALETAKRSAF